MISSLPNSRLLSLAAVFAHAHACQVSRSEYLSACTCVPARKSPSAAESICVLCLSMNGYLNANSLSAACTGLQTEQTTERCSARWQQPLGEWCNAEEEWGGRRRTDREPHVQTNTTHTVTRPSQIEVAAQWGRLCNRSACCQIGEAFS